MAILALLQVLLPLAMTLWLVVGRPPSMADALLRIAASWSVIITVAVAGIWLALPLSTLIFLITVCLAGSYAALRRTQRRGTPTKGPQRLKTWIGRAASGAVVSASCWFGVPALIGNMQNGEAVELAFPFKSGRYIVVNGGSTAAVNAHLMTLDPRHSAWRGQSFAVDLIRVDDLGFRTRRAILASPADPQAYLTFGTPVHAPCTGTVEQVETTRPDMPVPLADRQTLEGNFVRLSCGGLVVLLAHLRQGGVRVAAGQEIRTGDLLGEVGNSGNSDEPHLHVHVQRPGTPTAPLSGDPLPLTFAGVFPVRNMILDGERLSSGQAD